MSERRSHTHAYREAPAMVLGASGFIGQWVAHALHVAGARLAVVVRPGSSGPLPFEAAGTSIIHADLSHEHEIRQAIAAARPSIVFNLAGYGVDREERDDRIARTINGELPRWLTEALAERRDAAWPGSRLVHVGSALEYGEMSGDLREDSPTNATTLYGRTKLAGTLAVQHAGERLGLRALTARLFTVYGAGEHAGRLLPSLIAARANNAPIALSEGGQQRDFTYVEDVADGLLRLGVAHDAMPGDIVNLATGRLTSVREFVEQAAVVLGIPTARLNFGAVPVRAEEMAHDPVNIAKLRRLTGWAPATSVPDGVRRTLRALEALGRTRAPA